MAKRFQIEAIFRAVDKMTAPLAKMQRGVGKFTRKMELGLRNVNRMLDKTTKSMKNATVATARLALVGVGAVTGAVTLLIREYSKLEDAEAAFTPLTGGAEKARKLVAMLNETAASTPFQFEDLANVTSQLLPVMNGDLEKTVETLRMMGDTAGGSAQKLETITRGFSKAMLKGKVDLESLNMIAEAGVPIMDELSKSMGVTKKEIFGMVSAGTVTPEHLIQAFKAMTREGGIFHRGMEISSKTTSGMWSTMKDNISLTAASLGGALAPAIKGLIMDVTKMAKAFRVWADANSELINEKFTAFVDNVVAFFKFMIKHGDTLGIVAVSVVGLVVALKSFVLVMTAVNLVVAANPLVLMALGAITALSALVFAVRWVVKNIGRLRDEFLAFPAPVKIAILAVMGPIGWLIGAALLIKKHWGGISAFFKDLWSDIAGYYQTAIDFVSNKIAQFMKLIETMKQSIAYITTGQVLDDTKFLINHTMGGDDSGAGATPPAQTQMITPQDRTAESVREMNTSTSAEVVIRDETGRAEVTKGKLGAGLTMLQTGAFA